MIRKVSAAVRVPRLKSPLKLHIETSFVKGARSGGVLSSISRTTIGVGGIFLPPPEDRGQRTGRRGTFNSRGYSTRYAAGLDVSSGISYQSERRHQGLRSVAAA